MRNLIYHIMLPLLSFWHTYIQINNKYKNKYNFDINKWIFIICCVPIIIYISKLTNCLALGYFNFSLSVLCCFISFYIYTLYLCFRFRWYCNARFTTLFCTPLWCLQKISRVHWLETDLLSLFIAWIFFWASDGNS